MGRLIGFVYGLICYAITMATFVVFAAFVGNFGFENTLDAPGVGEGLVVAVLHDVDDRAQRVG